jgi:hypothetical protein
MVFMAASISLTFRAEIRRSPFDFPDFRGPSGDFLADFGEGTDENVDFQDETPVSPWNRRMPILKRQFPGGILTAQQGNGAVRHGIVKARERIARGGHGDVDFWQEAAPRS